MKKNYPIYEKSSYSQIEKVFDSFSKKNKEAIKNFAKIHSINSKSKKRQLSLRRALIRFFDFIEKDFNELNYENYVSVAVAISNSKLGVYTRNTERDFIKRFLKENFDDWRSRFKDFKLLKSQTKPDNEKLTSKDLITLEEVEKQIKATDNMRHKALISVLYESGSRPDELIKLRWSDVDFSKKMIYLYSGKTQKSRNVPLKNSIAHLQRLKNETEAKDDNLIFPITNAGLNSIIKSVSEKARIKKNIYPYIYRHSRLSFLITELSPKVYEEVSGHSLTMGMKTYAHLSTDKILKEMNEKVFGIEELTPKEQEEIKLLKEELADFKKVTELDNKIFKVSVESLKQMKKQILDLKAQIKKK